MRYTSKDYIIDSIKEYCNDNDLSLREEYSGRYMYGGHCIGIVCEDPLNTFGDLIAYIADGDEELSVMEILSIMGSAKSDNMAFKYILYFPKLKMCE